MEAHIQYGNQSYRVSGDEEVQNVKEDILKILRSEEQCGFVEFERPDGRKDSILISPGVSVGFHDSTD